jgi:transaldolase
MPVNTRLHRLADHGQSVWIDFLSRELLESGALARPPNATPSSASPTHFHGSIARPNLLVKIPATDAGVPAIEEMTARGYAINVTLIFSLARHRQVAEAYLRGLERLVASGGDPSRVHSVASFFVSRVDTETDRRLSRTGRDDLKGGLGIVNAKLAYQQYKALFHGERWADLAVRGATAQRCLWASTSVKDPSLRDTLYVEELIGPETISTMPEETIRALRPWPRRAAARVRSRRGAVPVQQALRRRRRLRRRRGHPRARRDREVRRFL